jgi:predicted MFS family arabinose efflux permease
MCWIGAVGTVFSIMMTSLCMVFYQFLLAQGILLGISMALVTWPMLALVGKCINAENRGAALGIVLAGSSLGGVIWPIAIDKLLKASGVGFPWTMRIVGFIMIPCFGFACLVAKEPPTVANKIGEKKAEDGPDGASPVKQIDRKVEAVALFKKPALQLLSLAMFVTYFGMFSPFFYTTSYAVSKGFSSSFAFYTVSIVNGASFFGRVVPGFVADKYGKFNCVIVSTLLAGLIALCWTKVDSVAGLGVWSAAYGFASGVSLPTILLSLDTKVARESSHSSKHAQPRLLHLLLWVLLSGLCRPLFHSRMRTLLHSKDRC